MRFRLMAIALSGLLLSPHLRGQTAPTFEVASVKPSAPGTPRGQLGLAPGGRFVAVAATLPELIAMAYAEVRPLYRFQITGGPDWLDRERFDITAIGSSGAADPSTFAEAFTPLRALLADRFKLSLREETRDAPVYALVLASRHGQLGPKLRRAPLVLCPDPGSPAPPPPPGTRCEYRVGYGTMTGRGVTINLLAGSIASFYGVGRLVMDQTGLKGGFDVDMEWAPMTQFRQPGNLDPPPDSDRAMNTLPTLFAALKEQLGLALEPARAPVRSFVVERAERPSPD
jgi:uncharacterized protein (TIGR03435 family)